MPRFQEDGCERAGGKILPNRCIKFLSFENKQVAYFFFQGLTKQSAIVLSSEEELEDQTDARVDRELVCVDGSPLEVLTAAK